MCVTRLIDTRDSFICWTFFFPYVRQNSLICVTRLVDVCLHSFICVSWLIRMCDMSHSFVWHDSFICVTELIRLRKTTHSYMWHGALQVWHEPFISVTWLFYMCDMEHYMRDMNHLYVRLGSFICVTWITYMCDRTRSFSETKFWPLYPFFFYTTISKKRVFLIITRTRPKSCQPNPPWLPGSTPMLFQEAFRAAWLLYVCEMNHIYVRLGFFKCVTWIIYMWTWLLYVFDMEHYMCDRNHSNVWHDSCICVT